MLFCSHILIAQNIFKGSVSTSNGIPLPNASVIAYDVKTNKILSHTRTDKSGKYNISISNQDIIKIEFSAFGYETFIQEQNIKDAPLVVNLWNKEKVIKEIVITKKNAQDTIQLKTENLTENSTLRDILNKNNGIEVSKNGAIMVDGKPVNKILVNKKEVFINQNPLALDNITNDIVKNVSIINNYRDKFDVDFHERKTTVINIDTKESFRGVLKNNIEVLGGYKGKFALKTKSMLFSDKFNFFATQEDNNLAKHNFSTEITDTYSNNSISVVAKESISSFMTSNRNVNKDFSNSSSATLRKEFNKMKVSTTAYYYYLTQNYQTNIQRETNNNVLNKENYGTNFANHLTALNVSVNYLFNKKNMLYYDLKTAYINHNTTFNSEQENFLPTRHTALVENTKKSQPFVMVNNLKIKSFIDKNILWENDLFLTNEFSKTSLNTLFEEQTKSSIYIQNIDIKNSNILFASTIDFKYKKLIHLIGGIEYTHKNENIIHNLQNKHSEILRISESIGLPITIRGDSNKMNYFVKINTIYHKLNSNGRHNSIQYHPLSLSFYYNFNSRNRINAFFEKNLVSNEISHSIDENITSYNHKIISKLDYANLFQEKFNMGLRYGYNNIPKNNAFSISAGRNISKNSLATVFDKIDQNLIHYKIIQTNYSDNYFMNILLAKGFYFSENLHKITFKSISNISQFKSKSYDDHILPPTSAFNFKEALSIIFEPQNFPFDELSYTIQWNKQMDFINDIQVNSQHIIRNSVNLLGEKGNFYYNIVFFHQILSNNFTKNKRKDIDFRAKYKIKNNFYVTSDTHSLLTLFGVSKNDMSNIIISTKEGIKTSTITPNIMGYITAGIEYKF